ncbi:MAG: hypothetical protein ABI840_10145 [bacterium]
MEINPHFYGAYLNLGVLFKIKGDYDIAILYLNKAIEMDKRIFESFLSRASLFLQIDELNKAYEDIEIAMKIKDNNADSYYIRGSIRWRKGLHEESINDFKMASIFDKNMTNCIVDFYL